jgi:hypothetical protein
MSKFDGDLLIDPSEYWHIVGALQYVTITRLDIVYSVNQLCQHMQAPTSTHWILAKRVLCYLKHTVDFGLHYKPSTVALHAFYDANWAGNPDRRSSSGYDIYIGQCLVSWSSKKQPIVSRSSTEAEYRSLALMTAEVYWIYMLLRELHINLHHLHFGVIISVLCLWLLILFSRRELSILKLIIILFERRWLTKMWLFDILTPAIKLQISSPRATLLIIFVFCAINYWFVLYPLI